MAKKKNNNDVNALLKFRLGLKHRISLYERLKSYIEEGFPVYDSLMKFKERYDKRKDFRGKIIGIWLKKMQSGNSFKNAIAGWVPEAELNLISAGEDGSGLNFGLQEAVRFAQSSQNIKSTIKKGVTYPAVLFIVIIVFICMFSIQLAPTYLEILPLEQWPDSASSLYALSNFLVQNIGKLVIIFALLGYIIMKTMGIWTGSIREIFDKVPPWSVYKVYQGCAFLISLSSMMQSSVPLNDALLKIRKTSSPWLAQYIDQMLKNLRQGGKFGKNLDVGLLDQETADDVIDYADLGKFEQAIYSIGEKNLKEAVEQIDARMAIIKNVMLVLVGISVALIYTSSIELSGTAADAAALKK